MEIIGDSQLVIKQISKEYKCTNESLIRYLSLILRLLDQFDNVIVRQVPRDENFEATELAQLRSRYKINTSTLKKLIELKGQCTVVDEREVCLLD